MPELFGNAYILPVIIVVVLLLVLMLILMVKRRRGAGPKNVRPAERVAVPPPVATPTEAPKEPAAPSVPTTQPVALMAQSAVPDKPSSPTGPVTRVGEASERAALADDPLKAVIIDIVHGWGELTSEDTNRLDLFRPDKVLAEAETIELPKDDAGGGYARARLLAIRKYAADKQLKPKPSETAATPLWPEPTVETEATRPKATEIEAVTVDAAGVEAAVVEAAGTEEGETEASTPILGSPLPEGMATGAGLAGAGLAAAAFTDAVEGEPIEDRGNLEKALAAGESEWSQTPEPVTSPPWPEEPQPGEPAVPSPWTEAPAGWDAQEPTVFEEVPVETDEETPLAAAGAVGISAAEELSPGDDMTARVQASDYSLSSLHLRVRTAEELMALPPGEQADMLAFLEPPELAKVVETSEDRELKKAVIDVLENLGNPASLDVLHRSFDDPDPEIQLYALDAADRLLGVE